ncbi:MAG: MBG domain-containing protein [Ferruginibacter sp.]
MATALPAGWTVRTSATATSAGSVAAFNTTATAATQTTGAFYNVTGASDRAPGVRQSGSFGDPGAAFVLQLANTSDKTNFSLSFKLMQIASGVGRTTTWNVDYGFGAAPSSFTNAATNPATLTTAATVGTTNVTVNFSSSLNDKDENVWIRIVTKGATSGSGARAFSAIDDVSLSWDVPSPALSAVTLGSALTNVYGTASTPGVGFTASGSNLTTTITATPQSGYQVSTTSATAGFQSAAITGIASGTTVYVRNAATKNAGTTNGATAVVLSSDGATNVNVTTSASGNTVSPANSTISVTGSNSFVYTGAAQGPSTSSVTGSGGAVTYSYSGTSGTIYGPSATRPTNAGTYTATASVAASGNYNGASSSAFAFAINKVSLTVTAQNKSKAYDGSIYSAGYTSVITGFVNSENSGVVTGSATYAGSAIAATAAGSYTITPQLGTLTATNYSFGSFVNGTLTISGINETTADFRSKQAGNLSSASTWEYNGGGGGYVNASAKPGTGNNVEILHNVTFDEGFTVGAGKTLKVSAGTANFNGQLVTFKSTSAGTASFGQLTGSVTGDNNVTVERYIPNGNRSWRLLSAPTHTSGQTVRQAWMEGDVNAANQNNLPGYGTIISAVTSQVANGFDAVSPSTSIRTYNGSTFVAMNSVNVALASTGGYFLYIRGDRSLGVNAAASSASSTTLRSNGTLYKGTQTSINIPTNTFGLIGNIYASEIDFQNISKSNVVNTLYVWDAKMGVTGGYEIFPGIDNYAASTGGGSWAKDEINSKIQSGQAFFVAATNAVAGGTITLTESSKTTTSNTKGLRPAAPAVVSKLKTRLLAGDKAYDGNVVVFDSKYQNTIDANDAPKFDNPGENFAIVCEGKQLAAEARQLAGTESIAYAMKNMKQQDYALEFTATNLGSGEAYLEDKFLGTKTPVSLSGVTKVSFSVTADPQSAAAGRFQLVLRPAAALAVDNRIASISVYPNPVETGTMNVQFVKQAKGKYNLKLVDLAGRVVYSSVREHAGGSAAQSVQLPSAIGRGSYQLVITNPDKTKQVQQLFINK